MVYPAAAKVVDEAHLNMVLLGFDNNTNPTWFKRANDSFELLSRGC